MWRSEITVSKEINELMNVYCRLRDKQYAVYSKYAKQRGLTTNELFVLDILWFAPDGCTQTEICERLSTNKQTITAIVTRFRKKGYVTYNEVNLSGHNVVAYGYTKNSVGIMDEFVVHANWHNPTYNCGSIFMNKLYSAGNCYLQVL